VSEVVDFVMGVGWWGKLAAAAASGRREMMGEGGGF
jgi:hypothetical protein